MSFELLSGIMDCWLADGSFNKIFFLSYSLNNLIMEIWLIGMIFNETSMNTIFRSYKDKLCLMQ